MDRFYTPKKVGVDTNGRNRCLERRELCGSKLRARTVVAFSGRAMAECGVFGFGYRSVRCSQSETTAPSMDCVRR